MLDFGVSSDRPSSNEFFGSASFAVEILGDIEGNSTAGGTMVGIIEEPSGFLRVVMSKIPKERRPQGSTLLLR